MPKTNLLKFSAVSALTASFYATYASVASASADDALKNAGITKQNITGTSGFFSDLKNIVYLIMGIGGIWAVGWLVVGGMLLAGSGSNPQKRSGGLAAIAVACVGVYIIYKAYDIAGYAVNISGGTTTTTKTP